ncbi:hypothetical protein [Paenibacillus ehimensis]|uniref:Uncharacterized protein n=1 Tax=Paenibacillus ehimensis TaxID=79264 RepID=A0ABT8VM03_9BACL|nr:hypothetical protein [Paenibacillus ehimensis]MDO3682014.1 hypothetical protein [Paenibacillus ehimensis]
MEEKTEGNCRHTFDPKSHRLRQSLSHWEELPEEPLEWFWKLLGYGGRVVIYAMGIGYIALTIAAMFYYAFAFAHFVLR